MKRTLTVRLAGAILFLAGAFAAFTFQAQQPPLSLIKVADDLYVVEGGGAGNVGVYITDEGVIVIDDKFEQHYDEIVANIRMVTDQPIRYVLNTHHHGDHSGGNEKFLDSNAEVITHQNAYENMVRGNQPGVPRLSYADQMELRLGGKTVRAKHFGRGHTDGDAVIFFPALRAVHTGDLHAGNPYIDYGNGGSLKQWSATLESLLAEDFDIVIPGHGPVGTRSDVLRHKANVEELREMIGRIVREGGGADEARAAIISQLGWPENAFQLGSVAGMVAEMAPAE